MTDDYMVGNVELERLHHVTEVDVETINGLIDVINSMAALVEALHALVEPPTIRRGARPPGPWDEEIARVSPWITTNEGEYGAGT